MTSSEDRIKEVTSIPMEIRELLNFCPRTELRPLALKRWTHEFVEAARSAGIRDHKITRLIRMAGKDNYNRKQINAVLRDNKLI
jgi:hypothetical protein